MPAQRPFSHTLEVLSHREPLGGFEDSSGSTRSDHGQESQNLTNSSEVKVMPRVSKRRLAYARNEYLKVRESKEIVRSDRVEPSWRPAVRFVIAVVSAAAISRFLWSLVPNQLSIKTDIVGYPIFADFNATRYTNGYYVIALVFPTLAVLIYWIVSSRGPLRRRPVPGSAMFPVAIARTAEAEPEKAPDLGGHVHLIESAWCLTRVALVALTVALEVAISLSDNLTLGNGGSYLGASPISAWSSA